MEIIVKSEKELRLVELKLRDTGYKLHSDSMLIKTYTKRNRTVTVLLEF